MQPLSKIHAYYTVFTKMNKQLIQVEVEFKLWYAAIENAGAADARRPDFRQAQHVQSQIVADDLQFKRPPSTVIGALIGRNRAT